MVTTKEQTDIAEQSFHAFTDELSKLNDYYLTILHLGDPKQALVYVIKKSSS